MRGFVASIWVVSACSEYGVVAKTDVPDSPGDTAGDSGESVSWDACAEVEPPEAYDVSRDEECVAEPEVGTFSPVIEWQWSTNPVYPGYEGVMMTPVVGNVTDDDGDGDVDEDDTPDIAFTSYYAANYGSQGPLNLVSGDGSGTHWSILDACGHWWLGSAGVAIGDLEGDGFPEVCVAAYSTGVVCVDGRTGTCKWGAGAEIGYYGYPAIADLDGNGLSEVIMGRQVLDSAGTLVGLGAYGMGSLYGGSYGGMTFAVDMDSDGALEVVAGNTVYEADGTVLWYDGLADGMPAVGDFDLDGEPEVVRVGGGQLILADTDGTTLWATTIPGSGNGGPPTVADFDGDGEVEVGVANLSWYSVFDTDGSVIWSMPTDDDSSSVTGSSVFDFEGDGAAEVVYADENTLWVFAGATGDILLREDGHSSGTLWEYPIVADVDGDDSTEIVVGSNNMWAAGWNGITVIGDANSSWAPARPIWNQHAYHITNVESDGGIPTAQTENWLSWNNFRAGGTELGPGHWQPDLAPGEPTLCEIECSGDQVTIWLPIENGGLVAAESFTVSFYASQGGTNTLVHQSEIVALEDGSSAVLGPFELSKEEWGTGVMSVTVDDGHEVEECDESDNTSSLGAWPCEE